MSSISCDIINPKHGNRVTIIAPDFTISDWTTATATATTGPIGSPSTVDVVVSWKQNGNYVTISIPHFTFAGANDILVFSIIPDLPAPLEVTRFPLMQTEVSFNYEIGCVIVGVNRRLAFFRNIKDGNSTYSSGRTYEVFPAVFEYKTA